LTETIEGDIESHTQKDRIENGKESVSISAEGSINKHAKAEIQNNSVENSKQF
jgi:type VI secretion system secreted protein VgrG